MLLVGERRLYYISFKITAISERPVQVVMIYTPKCNPFNMLSNDMFNLAIYFFVCELNVEIYLY